MKIASCDNEDDEKSGGGGHESCTDFWLPHFDPPYYATIMVVERSITAKKSEMVSYNDMICK